MTLWIVTCQTPLFMGVSRPKYWSGFPRPPPVDFPNLGIELMPFCLPHWQVGSLPRSPPGNVLVVKCIGSGVRLIGLSSNTEPLVGGVLDKLLGISAG